MTGFTRKDTDDVNATKAKGTVPPMKQLPANE